MHMPIINLPQPLPTMTTSPLGWRRSNAAFLVGFFYILSFILRLLYVFRRGKLRKNRCSGVQLLSLLLAPYRLRAAPAPVKKLPPVLLLLYYCCNTSTHVVCILYPRPSLDKKIKIK